MKLEKEAIINGSLIDFKNNKNEYPIYIDFKMILNEEEYRLIKKIITNKNVKLTLEIKDPILDETERKYLSGVIRPFRDDVEFICKNGTNVDSEYINIGYYKNDNTLLPCFKKGTMYKGMKLNKEYTLDDLNL